jgi:hypothetical protein
MEALGRLISFISTAAPQQAESILERILEVSSNDGFKRSVGDYLRMVRQMLG